MELPEKIQKLRKDRGLTQEQFAELLFVSRTAVSKWETGRGMPSMESLQMIAKVGGVTLDALLRAEEVVTVAENESKERINRFASVIDGIINLTAVLGLLLPLYKAEAGGMYYAVPLYRFEGRFALLYWVFPLAMAVCGIAQILVNRSEWERMKKTMFLVGGGLHIGAVFLLILSGQPYPAALFFALLLAKFAVSTVKRQ